MEPANFPEIYTGNGDESDRMQDIAGCFDPIIPRNDGFQYDIEAAASDVCHGKDKWKLPILPVAPGKIIPGRSAVPPSPAPGRKNHPRRELRYFSVPAPAPRAYESSRGNRSVRDRPSKNYRLSYPMQIDFASHQHVRHTVKTVQSL